MRSVLIVVALLGAAFFIGLSSTLLSPRHTTSTQEAAAREFTLEGLLTVPTGTTAAAILGSISVNGDIPAGSTMNVEARQTGTAQFSTVLQNIPAKSNQTFSYTKATLSVTYDMKVTLLSPTSKVIGSSEILTVSAPSLNVQFKLDSVLPPATPTPSPEAITPTPALTPTLTPPSTLALATISGNISFYGVTPINSRIVILQKLANASSYQVAVDNVLPINGTMWQWDHSLRGTSYSVIAVLKQKRSDGMDTDFASSAPITVTAPAASTVLTVNSHHTLTKPSEISSVSCTTYNGGPNQNTWNVTVNFPSFTGAQSYWLEIGTTDGGYDIANTYGSATAVSTVFKNNTAYYARYAYAAVSGVDTGSGQYSIFSDTTRLMCSK